MLQNLDENDLAFFVQNLTKISAHVNCIISNII